MNNTIENNTETLPEELESILNEFKKLISSQKACVATQLKNLQDLRLSLGVYTDLLYITKAYVAPSNALPAEPDALLREIYYVQYIVNIKRTILKKEAQIKKMGMDISVSVEEIKPELTLNETVMCKIRNQNKYDEILELLKVLAEPGSLMQIQLEEDGAEIEESVDTLAEIWDSYTPTSRVSWYKDQCEKAKSLLGHHLVNPGQNQLTFNFFQNNNALPSEYIVSLREQHCLSTIDALEESVIKLDEQYKACLSSTQSLEMP